MFSLVICIKDACNRNEFIEQVPHPHSCPCPFVHLGSDLLITGSRPVNPNKYEINEGHIK